MISIRKIIREVTIKLKMVSVNNKNASSVNPQLLAELKKDINAGNNTGNYSPTWRKMIEEFKHNITNGDIGNFLRWDIVKRTITSENSTLVDVEYAALKNDKNFKTIWYPLLVDNGFGNPERFWKNSNIGVNKIHQVYHLMCFYNYSGIQFEKINAVLEFGGGYGNMCQLFSQINPNGKYFIFDFPEMLSLQKFYLNSQNIKTAFDFDDKNYCTLYTDINKLELILKSIPGKKLFIATWSFSESPTELRDSFTSILKEFDYFIIAFQDHFDNITNSHYFKQWTTQFNHISWELKEIPHFKNNFYIFGRIK